MANDILNNAGAATGTSRIGKSVVATGGRRTYGYKVLDPTQPRVDDTAIADVAAKFDARMDDPRYYTGDAVT